MIIILIILGMIGAIAGILALYAVFTREPEDEYPDVPADPDGTATSAWLRSCAADPGRPVAKAREVHHELSPFPAAEMPEMPPPDQQPEPDWSATAWTRAQARELEQWMDENIRSVPVPGADDLDEMARRYAEVTSR